MVSLQVFELGGEVVEPSLADNLMRLIAEGAGEDDEAADTELRAHAVSSYMKLLEKPKLPDVLLQVRPRIRLPKWLHLIAARILCQFGCQNFHYRTLRDC